MKIAPYIYFKGNAAEAIAFYENVFGIKGNTLRYADVAKFDPSYKIEKGTENLVMHSDLNFCEHVHVQISDMPTKGKGGECHCIAPSVCLQLTLKTKDEVTALFDKLSAGGNVCTPPSKAFWSPWYCEFADKFGQAWSIMQEGEESKG